MNIQTYNDVTVTIDLKVIEKRENNNDNQDDKNNDKKD